jgi:hypothetical protein
LEQALEKIVSWHKAWLAGDDVPVVPGKSMNMKKLPSSIKSMNK